MLKQNLVLKANYSDKPIIINILSESFDTNKSVNYVTKQDQYRAKRIRNLMEYAFELCYQFGEVYLSDDKMGCMLVLYPEKKKTTLKTIYFDLKLALMCIGISRIGKVLKRESKIKQYHPKHPIYYLWFVGVKSSAQRKGIGGAFVNHAIQESARQQKSIFLETSTLANIPWYQKFGFSIIQELDLGYKLYMLKRDF